jgi:hypothetical protein
MIHKPFLFYFLSAGLIEANEQAAIHGLTADIGIAARGKRHPAGEKALRQLKLMNERGAQLLRQNTPARDEQHTPVDYRVHGFGVYAWQGKKNQKLRVRFQDIGWRLPRRAAHLLLKRKKMLVEPLGP